MEQVKDDKKFFHVFPTLRADDDVRLLFSDVEVKKITTNSRRDFLNIYIFSRHLIQKKQIFQMEQCIKDLVKYADNVYDLSEYHHSDSKLTLEKLQEYAVKKSDIRLKGSQWGGAYSCSVAYSKNGKYFKFTGGYQVYNVHERATCMVGFFPLSHLSAL